MSAMVPVPSIAAVHYFAGPHGHVFTAKYIAREDSGAGLWALNVGGGALALDIDERAPAISQATTFARESWPEVGGLVVIDHTGHRA